MRELPFVFRADRVMMGNPYDIGPRDSPAMATEIKPLFRPDALRPKLTSWFWRGGLRLA